MKNLCRFQTCFSTLLILGLCFLCSIPPVAAQTGNDDGKVIHHFDDDGFVTDWIISGPFPNPLSNEDLSWGKRQTGFYTDYLTDIGGEAQARLSEKIQISYPDENGVQQMVNPKRIQADKKGIIHFEKYFGKLDHKVAYAFCYVYSEKDQEAMFLLGSDDGAQVWVNGELVHDVDEGRGLKLRDDRFSVKLNEGLNPVLLKIYDYVRGWGFGLELFSMEGYAGIAKQERYRIDYDDFLNCRLIPAKMNTWNYVFGPGDFPEMKWEKPYLVEKLFGSLPMKIRWFDKNLSEVEKAENPGRYAFYAEGETSNGITIRRAGTLYCMPWEWIAWAERPRAELKYFPFSVFNKTAWQQNKETIADFAGRIVLLSMMDQEEGAVLLSYLDEMEPSTSGPDLLNTPIIRDHEYQLKLKRRILGVEN